MTPVATEALLRCIAGLAERREALPAGLRASGLPGAEALAGRLEQGGDLRSALAAALPGPWADLIAGPHPPLEQAALLAAEELRLGRQFRATVFDAVAYPLASLLVLLAAGGWAAWRFQVPITGAWLLAAVPGLVLAGVPLLGLAGERIVRHLPLLCGWSLHARRAGRYERAALAARWHLPEADLGPLLGRDLVALAPVLGTPGAEVHCRRLADHHRRAAERGSRRLAWSVALGLHLIAAALVLAALSGLVAGWNQSLMALGE